MATERQIAANRANAQKSTGPKTAVGRLKSSRNAFRHGLSLPSRLDIATSAKADAIARLLARDQADDEQLTAATEVAQAQLELLRIREVRAKLVAEVDLTSGNLEPLRRLAALDRYERFAATKRRRAAHRL
jgi:hypothetical protein